MNVTTTRRLRGARISSVIAITALAGFGLSLPAQATSSRSDSSSSHSKALVPISIGTAGATAVYDPVFTGLETGLFRKNGFAVTWDNLTPTSAAAAILNGNINIAMAGNSMVAAMLTSPTAKVIFTNGPTVFYLVAGKGITSISQLAGKTCGATTAGGAIDVALRGAFAAAHVPINITYLQTNSASVVALENGNVQCAGVSPPTYEQALEAGLTAVEPISQFVQTSFIATNSSWASHHKAQLVKFIKVYAQAVKETVGNRLYAEAGLRDYVGTTVLSQLNGSWNQYRRYWEIEPYPPAQMRTTLKLLTTANPPVPQAATAKLSQVIDNSYLNACGKACVVPSIAKGAWQ